MLHQIKAYLSYEIFFHTGNLWRSSLWIGGMLFLLMFTLEPHSFDQLPFSHQLRAALMNIWPFMLGYILACTMYRRDAKNWKRWHHYILIVIGTLITTALLVLSNSMLNGFMVANGYDFDPYLTIRPRSVLVTLMLNAALFTSLNYAKYLSFLKKKLNKNINAKLNANIENDVQDVYLRGRNKNEILRIPSHRLICLKSEGHYIKIVHLAGEKQELKITVFRNTLKEMELQTVTLPSAFKCHKSYIINLNMVRSIRGKAQQSYLYLRHLDDPIPISPAKIGVLRKYVEMRKVG